MIMMFLIERSEYDDVVSMLMMFLIERSEYDDDVFDRKIRMWWWLWSTDQNMMMMMLLLIERSRCWRCCCWSKSQNAEDVADQKDKMLKILLLIKKNQSAEDVADRKFKMLKMSLLIEQSKCWICCWSKGPSAEDVVANWNIKDRRCCWWWRLKIEDEDYMMLKRFQWFIYVLPCWCWWCPPISSLVVVDVEYPSR